MIHTDNRLFVLSSVLLTSTSTTKKYIMPETCETVVKKVYRLCGGDHKRCTKGRGKKATHFKTSVLKAIIPTITPGDLSIDEKVCILDKHLGNNNNKEYRVCCFIAKKIEDKLLTNGGKVQRWRRSGPERRPVTIRPIPVQQQQQKPKRVFVLPRERRPT